MYLSVEACVRLLHTEIKQSNFLENLPHREIEIIWSRFYYDKMQDVEWIFTEVFILKREAPKGSLYKKRDRELITKEVLN